MTPPLTSRLCRKCGGWFDTGLAPYELGNVGQPLVKTRQELDRHCGDNTKPVPTFDLEWAERRDAMRAYCAVNL